MAKKIRFPLVLADGAEVRTIDELREHFDLAAIIEYFKSKKLLTWLEDRYLEGEANIVRELDDAAPDFQQRLCEALGVEFSGEAVDLEAIEYRRQRLEKLRAYTNEDEFLQNIDAVAFDQEELADLLDEDIKKIYLCGEKFTVPASKKGITYVGVNNPSVHISGVVPETLENLGFTLTGTDCDNLPQSNLPAEADESTKEFVECDSCSTCNSGQVKDLQNKQQADAEKVAVAIQKMRDEMGKWNEFNNIHLYVNFSMSSSDMYSIDGCSKSKCQDMARSALRRAYSEGQSYLTVNGQKSISNTAYQAASRYIKDTMERLRFQLEMLKMSLKRDTVHTLLSQLFDEESLCNQTKRKFEDELNDSYYSLYDFSYFLDNVEYENEDYEMEDGFMRLFEMAAAASTYTFDAMSPFNEIEEDTEKYVEHYEKEANAIVKNILLERKQLIEEALSQI